MFYKKILSIFIVISVIISLLYLNEGCKIEIFKPTPTLTPTLTPTPTPNKAIIIYFKDAKKIIDNFKIIISNEKDIVDKVKLDRRLLATTFSNQEAYNIYTQFFNNLNKQEKLIKEFKRNHPKDYLPDFTLFIEEELSFFKDAERIVYGAVNDNPWEAYEISKKRINIIKELRVEGDSIELNYLRSYIVLCEKGEQIDNVINQLFNQGLITCNMGQYFYK